MCGACPGLASQVSIRAGLVPTAAPRAPSRRAQVVLLAAMASSSVSTPPMDVDAIIAKLLEVRGSRPGKQVQLLESEIRGLCTSAREIFMNQPVLLELEAPIKICGARRRVAPPRRHLVEVGWWLLAGCEVGVALSLRKERRREILSRRCQEGK